MTGYERTLMALDFQITDRIPVVGGFIRHASFLSKVAGVDLESFWADPRSIAIRAFKNLKVDCIIGLILPDQNSAIGAQVMHSKNSTFSSPEDILEMIKSLETIEEVHRNFNFDSEYEEYLHIYETGHKEIGDDILWLPNCFRYVAQFQNEGLFGAENYYMALALYPDAMKDFFRYSGEVAFLRNTAVAKAIVDYRLPRVVWLGQDTCDNRGPYIAADELNDMYIKYVSRSLEPLKAIGVKVIWHSDGNISPIAEYLLDAGIDGFQGLQESIEKKVNIDIIRKLSTKCGKPPVIVGSVSSTSVMPFGSVSDVRTEVRRCKKLAASSNGGWMLNFSSSIGPEVPEENIAAFFDESFTTFDN